MFFVYILSMLFSSYIFLRQEKKYKKSALIMLAGSILAVVIHLGSVFFADCSREYEIIRNEKAGRRKYIELNVDNGKTEEKVKMEVFPQTFTEAEKEELFGDFIIRLDQIVKAENVAYEHVDKNLEFPSTVKGYPFQISWQTSDRNIIDENGKLSEEISENGKLVKVIAQISWEEMEFQRDYIFYVCVFPRKGEELYFERLKKYLQVMEKETRDNRTFHLPDEFENKALEWREAKQSGSTTVYILFILLSVGYFAGQRKEEEEKRKKRRQQMEMEYPGLVSKTALFIGAGMTVNKVFKKLALEGKTNKENVLTKEIMITCHEMESGISEAEAFRNMGKRCGLPSYMRFMNLLIQYTKKGGHGLCDALHEETETALKERRERAKRIGEEAGTKLLLPMMLMLILVMVLIMIPAFYSFHI